MTTPSTLALSFAGNGVDRPLHQDRQVLRAGDLTLEQAAQDAMLARARSYLHGWGIVAGFEPAVTGSTLHIGPGYGVTPLGDELFLPRAAELLEAAARAVACCGPGPLGCASVDAEALARARAAAQGGSVHAWLIARPASREAAPRPGVPEGCAHPAMTSLPSRRCGGVELGIICSLPQSHVQRTVECGPLMPFVCGRSEGAPPILPWEEPLGAEANFLVIAKLTVTDGVLTADTGLRRRLLPVWMIQDWIASCLCPTFAPAEPDPSPEDEFARLIQEGRALSRRALLALRDGLTSAVIGMEGIGNVRAAALAALGVDTEGDFLIASPERLAAVLNLPRVKVAEMKNELNQRHGLGLEFR